MAAFQAPAGVSIDPGLILRIEIARAGRAELDRAIGEATGRGYHEDPCLGLYGYTNSIDAAVGLVPREFLWRLDAQNGAGMAHARVEGFTATAATPALALCAAALKAWA